MIETKDQANLTVDATTTCAGARRRLARTVTYALGLHYDWT